MEHYGKSSLCPLKILQYYKREKIGMTVIIEFAYICDESDKCCVPRCAIAPGKPETTRSA